MHMFELRRTDVVFVQCAAEGSTEPSFFRVPACFVFAFCLSLSLVALLFLSLCGMSAVRELDASGADMYTHTKLDSCAMCVLCFATRRERSSQLARPFALRSALLFFFRSFTSLSFSFFLTHSCSRNETRCAYMKKGN